MSLKTAWLNLQDSLGNRFAWSHVNAVYYNWAQKKLLKEKLDDIDTAINAKVAKTDIVQVESTATDKVPSCAYIKNIKDGLDSDIAELNSNMSNWVRYSLDEGDPVPSNLVINRDIFVINGSIMVNNTLGLMLVFMSWSVKSGASFSSGWLQMVSFEGLAFAYPPTNNRVSCEVSGETVFRDLQVNGFQISVFLNGGDAVTKSLITTMVVNTL